MNADELTKQKDKFEKIRDAHVDAMNNSETEAVKQLIFITTIFITISFFAIQRDGIAEKFSNGYLYALVLSWLSLALSLFIGVIIFIRDVFFFERWAEAADHVVEDINIMMPESQSQINAISAKHFKSIPEHTSNDLLVLQITLFIIGVVLMLITVTRLIA